MHSACPKHLLWLLLLMGLTLPGKAQFKHHLDKPKLAAIPLINYNESFGGIFGAMGGLFFPIQKKDTISPASAIGAGGIYATNKTWFAFGFGKLYFHRDLWRTTVAGGTGDLNFQFYSELFGKPGAFIHYSTMSNFFYGEQLIRIFNHLYLGLDYTFYHVKTSLDDNQVATKARNYAALGLDLTYDSRDNVMNPLKGWYANARCNRFDEAFGSTSEYNKLDVDVSSYFGNDSTQVWAMRASASTALGKVPFEAQTVVGGNVLRGYSKGEYRGDQVYSLQAEYRWNFYRKWGAVFFAGMATPVNKGKEWGTDDLLPGGGLGIRYRMIPKIRLNIGFDAALGKDDFGLYFRIGEAF